ncbi:glycosyltransferase [Nitrospina sp. 32_T5]|uniref:glycosyltransferase family A protein n=1 Tax=unclassified Nitrospina TaxID=2638683 RepID=UPI003F977CCD
MEIVFQNPTINNPLVSFILLDWTCRESFHFLHYINNQTVARPKYEVIWIEYYTRRPQELKKQLEKSLNAKNHPLMDQWIVLDIPEDVYYHKHLMYNIGIALAHGDIVTICDSDAIVQNDFVETIIGEFDKNPKIALHMDEVRNNDRKFYPFNYPPLKEVLGKGAINYKDGTTTGLLDKKDPLHTRNYGACMSAKREDLIAIGGADEHIDYLGHVCGPYELTFRLQNFKRKEIWHPSHLLYHVWHPGQAGDNNYVGPHDGKHMSTTALEALTSGRVFPYQENRAIKSARTGEIKTPEEFRKLLIDPHYLKVWSQSNLAQSESFTFWKQAELLESIKDYNLVSYDNEYFGIPQRLGPVDFSCEDQKIQPGIIKGKSLDEVKKALKKVHIQRRKEQFCLLDLSKHQQKFWEFPELIGRFHNYNIFGYQSELYGLPQYLRIPLKEFVSFKSNKDAVSANDLNSLKTKIQKARAFRATVRYPFLFKLLGPDLYIRLSDLKAKLRPKEFLPSRQNHLVESHGHLNILEHDGFYFAVPQYLGAIDLCDPRHRNHPEILIGPSVDQLKSEINRSQDS